MSANRSFTSGADLFAQAMNSGLNAAVNAMLATLERQWNGNLEN